MEEARGGVQMPPERRHGIPRRTPYINTAFQRQEFASWEGCKHFSLPVDLCCRRHLCKDSEVLLDMQLKPLSQHIALALNLSWARGLKGSNPPPTILVPDDDVSEVSQLDKNLWNIPGEKNLIRASCHPIPSLHGAVICKSNKKWPCFPGTL